MFQIIVAMAEFELVLIAERVKAGIQNARARGGRIGNFSSLTRKTLRSPLSMPAVYDS